MRARNREVNIFNMSLLDILCGALGAFCFMMLTLFPHYGKGGGDPRPPMPPAPPAQNGMVPQEYADQLKKQINYLNKQLERANRDMDAVQQKVDTRDPITIQTWWSGGAHDIDLYVREKFGPKPTPQPDLNRKQLPNWNGDVRSDMLNSPGSEVWCMRDTPPGDYEIYLKLMDNKPDPPVTAFVSILTTKGVNNLSGAAKLSSDRRLYQVGLLRVGAGHKVDFYPSAQFRQDGQK
jgi:hypothetical protein